MHNQDFHCVVNLQLLCFSSSLVNLSATVLTFDDCLYLLDGRLNQLSELTGNVRSINTSSFNIDNTVSNFILNKQIFVLD